MCSCWKNREPVLKHDPRNRLLCMGFLWLHQWCSVTQLPCVDLRIDYINRCCIWPWPWWQFSRIIAPLFDSYNNMVSTASFDEVCRTTLTWLDQHCSLVALRPGWSIVFIFGLDSQTLLREFLWSFLPFSVNNIKFPNKPPESIETFACTFAQCK